MEFLLGFPKDHTRGISRTERYRSLGNSFQVDIVAYHLSVLKDMFPQGMNVLSLFSGIGGAEVALHRLGICMNTALEPDEMEFLLGFPKDHTRGINRTERYRSLGNSFQVDTVAYHLSFLKDMFPQGINVLSSFSGIGVIAVEKSEVNRTILRSWWGQTQIATLIEITDVQAY